MTRIVSPHVTAEPPREDYAAIHQKLVTQFADWGKAAEDPAFATTLRRAWSAIGAAAAAFLTEHPDATPTELVNAIEALNPPGNADEFHVSSSAIRLAAGNRATYAVSASFSRSGTFFVAARNNEGTFTIRWNINDLAAQHVSKRDDLAHWNWIGFAWGDGPLRGDVHALPPNRAGLPRFYVDAESAALAGGTWGKQISIWEWNGQRAAPLWIRSYDVSFDTPPMRIEGSTLTLHTKGNYKTFSTCGQCPEPDVLWKLDATPGGIVEASATHTVPELQLCDELFDRILHKKNASDLAAPAVIATVRTLLRDLQRESADHGSRFLGTLGAWQVTTANHSHALTFTTDSLDCRTLHFTMEERPQSLYIAQVRVVNRCP